ncbi:MAG: hypothetical protein Q4F72_12080, partial [Desulfovibrionaceae bacterium]|nr:hypothetical protein [Desulfovibrionaceae bacterium]
EREDCRLAWHLLDSLSLALGVQVFAAIPNPMLYEEAARAADGREDRVLFHLDFLLPGAQQIVRFAKERFAVGLEHPARLASLEKMRKKASEDAGRAAELDDLPRKTPPDPYLLVTAGKVRAVRGIDAGEAAALLKAAAGPSPVRDTFRPAWPASGPASLTKAPGGDHAPESGCRARCPDKGPAPAGVHVRGLRLQGLQGLQGFESLELGGLGRFTFVECAPGLDRAAIVAGLLLVSLCARPDALLELPELRGLKPTMASVRKVVTGLLRDAPHGHLTVAADCPSGLLTIALAGAGALMPDAFVAVRFADRAARLLADLRKRGQRRGVLFLKGEHGGCGTLDLSGDLPAVNWDPETFSRAVPMVRHVDAFRPADGAAAQAPACLGREDRLALDRILDGLVPDAPGLGATAPAGRPADNPAAIPIPGASPETQARAARLAAALFAARGGVLVIDNAGKGLPQTERTPLLKLVEGLARHLDVQILAFTEDPALHDAALAASGSGEDFCRLALGREKDSGDGGPGAGAESAGLTPRKDRPRLGQLPQPYPAEARLDVLEVQDFRGTRALWMSDFGSITVIMGKEGQDITLPLEACALLSVFRSPERLFLLNRLRGLPETAKGLAELARDLFGDRENRPLRVRGAVFFHEKTFETAMALGRYTKEIDSSVLPSRQEYICWPAKFGEQPPDDLPP